RIENCIISDNLSWNFGGGLAGCDGVIRNCTIVGNTAEWDKGGGLYQCTAEIVNCIITDNKCRYCSYGIQLYHSSMPTYSCYPGADGTNGNIDYDPLFADSGFVDVNDTPQNPSDDHWVSFYQLKSEYGRWNPVAQEWVYDDVTSPCIDAGDPADPGWQNELWPHGGRINIGAYGGTPQAGMSSNPMGNIADLDHDDTVGIGDLSLLTSNWLAGKTATDIVPPAGVSLPAPAFPDLNQNGFVDLYDLAILSEQWMWHQE
ncbi:MAG: hypothetical protein JXA82_16580, partial [Sedimentisphaerales bacterium]|nr:hypothetical protein [Sedimentisphaerales bacterium]